MFLFLRRVRCVVLALLIPGVARTDDAPKVLPQAPPPKGVRTGHVPKDPPTPAVPKDLEEKLVGRTPGEVAGVLNQLAQEWNARKGAVVVAHQRLAEQAEELRKVRLRLAALKEPDVKAVPLILRAADVDSAIKSAQQLADYHALRLKHVEEAAAASSTLLQLASAFDRAARACAEEIATIESALRLVRDIPAGKLPDSLSQQQLAETAQRLKSLAAEVDEARGKAQTDLAALGVSLKKQKEASAQAAEKLDDLKRRREPMLAAFAFEEQLRGLDANQLLEEFQRLRKALAEKVAAIKGDAADFARATAAVDEARQKLGAVKEPPVLPEEPTPATLPPLEQATRKLFAAQQQYAGRVRAVGEREDLKRSLAATIDEAEKKGVAYSATLEAARNTAGHLKAVVTEIDQRVGRGQLAPAKIPSGVQDASPEGGVEMEKLETDAAAIHGTLAQFKEERNALGKPDAGEENVKTLTAGLLAQVSARIDLVTDLKKLAATYALAREEQTDAERKRLDQRAAERTAREAGRWDRFFAIDRSRPAAELANLLDAYYKELIELEEKQDNIERQKKLLQKLVELTQKESADVAKLRAVLEKRTPGSEEAWKWEEWLADRQAPAGLRAEAALYHDDAARLSALRGANQRRIAALAGGSPEPAKGGEEPAAPSVVVGGEIGKTRAELFEARARGLTILGVEIGIVLLAALILPRLVIFILRRAMRGGADSAGNPSPVLRPLRGALRIGVWTAALALILSIFGFDVTALIVALAIGALAVALAARPMIADVLGSVVIFAERRFKVGDVVRLAGGEPARVIDLTWRSTALKNANGLVTSVPNRKVTEAMVENLSHGSETYDSLAVTISTDKDAGKVIAVIRAAMAQCKNVSPEHGVTVLSYNHRGFVKVVQYRFWWFLKDYETRNKTRDEVFARIALGLAHEDMTGIEVTLV